MKKLITTAACSALALTGTVATMAPQSAQAADGGQRVCSSKYSEVPIEVRRNGYRINPGKCVIIGTHDQIIVLGQSFKTAPKAGQYGTKCKAGYVYYDPANNYVKGFKAPLCHITV
jgi:hypothetical protein